MYREYKQLNLPEIDREILAFWDENRIFEKSVDQRDPANSFVFYEGPPSANGLPGIHHVMARAIKDIFCRFQTMRGKRVERKGGWDTHGLPIELSVEKELGITKEDIGKSISVEEYNAKCRETVMRYKDKWDEITRQMGYWVDLDNPYITYENNYIESVWFLLGRLYEKGLLYKGYTIQPYSPGAGTGLSSHELNMPGAYRDVTDLTCVAMFKVLNPRKTTNRTARYRKRFIKNFPIEFERNESIHLLAWTTTPWTLPANVALAVGEKIDYVKVRTYNRYVTKNKEQFLEPINVILAKNLIDKQFDKKYKLVSNSEFEKLYFQVTPDQIKNKEFLIPYTITGEYKGKDLKDLRYNPLFKINECAKAYKFEIKVEGGTTYSHRVILGDFVTVENGTGIVHIAPTFGADDFKVAKTNNIKPLVVKYLNSGEISALVDKSGKFVDCMPLFGGRYVKNYTDDPTYRSVDEDIVLHLKSYGKVFKHEKYTHSYPHCWRTDKPVLYYPLDSWFIRASAMKDRMFELNKTINWKPAATGEGRFGKWLENLQDWNLSRSRFWGVPLPIWRSADGKEEICIGSMEQLGQEMEKANQALGLSQTMPGDLHRPYIDRVVLVGKDGRTQLHREADLIDVWFDSGAMPYAQWHYPFENQEKFKQNFPADFIAEGVDQTRGWFYTLHAIATMVFDSVSFKNVVSNGLVLDKNGHKMSKRLGNAVDPFSTIATYGADATRWYMISNSQPWDNLRFDLEGVAEVRTKFFGKLYNTYSFFALYANVDQFTIDEMNVIPVKERPELDRWIISKLHSLIKEVTESYEDYEPTRAARAIENFVDEHLSNWYVRLSRRRFWRGEMSADKKAAYETLFECLMVVGQLMAPVAPFFADWLYRNLSNPVRERARQLGTPLAYDSVHLSLLTKAEEDVIDQELEQRMDYAQRISSLVLSLRKKEKIRVRQPLQKVLLPILDENFQTQVEEVKDLVLAEVNVKALEYVSDTSGLVSKKVKPNFKTLGKRLGKHMKAATDLIANWSQDDINRIEKDNRYALQIDGETYELSLEDVEITAEDIPGWQVATDGALTVALDITLDESLIAEGLARDLVNRIQNIRKDRDFNVTDRIVVTLERHDAILTAIEKFGDYIKSETLAVQINLADQVSHAEEMELSGDLKLGIAVERNA